jgi:predicted ATPase
MSDLPKLEPFVRAVRLRRDTVASFDGYPYAIPAVRMLERIELHPHVTFLIGENGSGKSTLLEAIAVKAGFNAEGGSRNFRFSTKASHSPLSEALVLERSSRRPTDGFFLRAESFYTLANEMERLDAIKPGMFDSYGGRSLHAQSHGEAFLNLLMHRLEGNGFYVFDEPEAALSPKRQLSVLVLLHDLVLNASQIVIATHSPILMAYPHAKIIEVSGDGLREVVYTETEHYRITHDFLLRHERMLGHLLADDAPEVTPA